MAIENTAQPEPVRLEQLRGMALLAQDGNVHAIAKLKSVLDDNPQLWQDCGNLARIAEKTWIDLITREEFFLQESLTRTIAAMKVELAGPSPTPLESLLVQRIVACWLQVQYADAIYAEAAGKSISLAHANHLERRAERAERRLMAAVKTLAVVRKLLPRLIAPEKSGKRGRKPAPIHQPSYALLPHKNGTNGNGHCNAKASFIAEPLLDRMRG